MPTLSISPSQPRLGLLRFANSNNSLAVKPGLTTAPAVFVMPNIIGSPKFPGVEIKTAASPAPLPMAVARLLLLLAEIAVPSYSKATITH